MLPVDGPVDVLIDKGHIVDVAPAGALRLRGEVLDGDGAWLIPGLWDHHVHAVQWALAADRIPLGDSGSAAESAHRMATAPVLDDGRRVGTGFRAVRWADAPDLALLDRFTGETPTYLINADVHSVWLNSAAFRREGFAPQHDGLLREEDAFEISRRLNAVDPQAADLAVIQAGRRAAARGVVGVVDFDMAWNAEAWRRRLAVGFDAHRVKFGVYPDDLERAIAEGLATGEPVGDDPHGLVRTGALKVISDGSLGTRTAACSHAYADDERNRGVLSVPPDELRELLTRATGAGFASAVHAIGDVALSAALDMFAATGAWGTIEHAQLIRHADVARLSRLGVAVSVQPRHAIDDRDAADELWASQTSMIYPLATLHRAGAVLRFGSDAPVAPLDPWRTIAAAVHRTDDTRAAWHAEEAVDLDVAMAASTRNGTGGDTIIAPGAVADLALIGRDPRQTDAEGLRTMPVHATLVAGRITHRA
nr:amidohydrolase family protein [Microbacterium pseudoresistens]